MVAKIEHKTRTQCPVACALDIIGDHWTLLIVRDMMFFDVHEYKDMLESAEKISSSILSTRLRKLENDDIISAIPHPENGKRKLYYLTERGKGLVRVMIEIARWSDHNLPELIHIPQERRELLDAPLEDVTQIVFDKLEQWEKTYLS
ncbi:winged helix-turn-helix transcriptional regulator [Vibrio quintilis]|uniref:HTH-type transcriptional regulator YodB n=1 Tax=Vibrio quintilis TaxID=1117707 RepID=A0A1M7YWM8_9VIBR|nr:helix-turn-helix domain-containing protein [Vibrio quintilis]SHO57034.1 HTH-type transcriptional regulator YodB [Vibrio quintilis]